MPLETGTTISDLDSSYPLGSDNTAQGDDHLRLIKAILKAQFPGVGGTGFASAITATETELNYVSGVTSGIQAQINTKAPLSSPSFTDTPTAPTPSVGDDSTKLATTAYVKDEPLTAAQISQAQAGIMEPSAFVCFNGTTGAIKSGHNVSSVTRTGTGKYTINFTSAMSDANYAALLSSTTRSIQESKTLVRSVNSISIEMYNSGGSLADTTNVSVLIHEA